MTHAHTIRTTLRARRWPWRHWATVSLELIALAAIIFTAFTVAIIAQATIGG